MNEIIEHWKWVNGFIDSLEEAPKIGLKTLEYIYKTAFEHGIKHGVNKQFNADTGRNAADLNVRHQKKNMEKTINSCLIEAIMTEMNLSRSWSLLQKSWSCVSQERKPCPYGLVFYDVQGHDKRREMK